MVIVEGPDGAGKTTLVNELCHEFGLQKGTAEKDRDKILLKNPRARTYLSLGQAVMGDTIRVYDRLFWSECVYGPILRGKSQFTLREEWRVMNIFRALQCPVIFVETLWDTCLEEVRKNPPQLEGWDEVKASLIWERYRDAADVAFGKGVNAMIYNRDRVPNREQQAQALRRAPVRELPAIKRNIVEYLEQRKEWTT